jgi:MoaA/NifB/PqqE/SkfB family radical SAM enzyme
MWTGPEFEGFRSRIRERDLSGPCHVCDRNIRNRVFMSALSRAYDNNYPLTDYPSVMEFELSNTCNLECVMCKGILSSTIRRDRDQLPPFKAPYDDAFVEQLEEFIPHLKEARFNGGEPLLQKICWDIWDRIATINPSIEITVATNGSTLNAKAKRLFERCRFKVNLSLDSLEKENYERIRKNAVLEETLSNASWYADYCKRIGTSVCIMVNPMRTNWHEMPNFVRFCSERGFYLWFNTIWRPPHLALWNLDSSELDRVHGDLARAEEELSRNPVEGPTFASNLSVYRNLVQNQISTWIREQRTREGEKRDHRAQRLARSGSKPRFLAHLKEHLSKAGNEKLHADFAAKLERLEERVSRNVSADDYYHHLLSQPLPMVLEDLKARSIEHLTDWVYRHDGYY